MAIILNDYQPSGDVEEVQFPGSKTRYEIPTSDDVLTAEILQELANGDYSTIRDLFPEDGRKLWDKLHIPQIKEFVGAWTGSAKN